MNLITLIVVAMLGALVGLVLIMQRHSDRTVIERMNSTSRVDGKNDPRAYLHHSSY